MTSRTKLKRKNVDDVLGGAETWKDADSTAGECFFFFGLCKYLNPSSSASCDKCGHGRAYFYQLQIRSADEPMTTCKSTNRYISLVSSDTSYMTVYRYVLSKISAEL
jgi:DNA-directed RNA polymerase III subunit RPC11